MGKRIVLLGGLAVLLVAGLAVVVAVLPGFLAGSALPAEPSSIHGTITNIVPVGSILVEEKPAEPSGGAKAAVTITADTHVRIGTRALSRAGQASDLHVGQQVEVWFAGPVLDSYPVQGRASTVLIGTL